MKKRILVIDDDEDILEVLRLILQNEGYHVIISSTGVPVNEIPAIKPDLVLLDLRLAGSEKNGDQICTEIKSGYNLNHLPVMLISAEPNVNEIADQCGANTYLQKPFDIHQLISQVRRLVA